MIKEQPQFILPEIYSKKFEEQPLLSELKRLNIDVNLLKQIQEIKGLPSELFLRKYENFDDFNFNPKKEIERTGNKFLPFQAAR